MLRNYIRCWGIGISRHLMPLQWTAALPILYLSRDFVTNLKCCTTTKTAAKTVPATRRIWPDVRPSPPAANDTGCSVLFCSVQARVTKRSISHYIVLYCATDTCVYAWSMVILFFTFITAFRLCNAYCMTRKNSTDNMLGKGNKW